MKTVTLPLLEVEAITDKTGKGNKVKYLVKWRKMAWLREENLGAPQTSEGGNGRRTDI